MADATDGDTKDVKGEPITIRLKDQVRNFGRKWDRAACLRRITRRGWFERRGAFVVDVPYSGSLLRRKNSFEHVFEFNCLFLVPVCLLWVSVRRDRLAKRLCSESARQPRCKRSSGPTRSAVGSPSTTSGSLWMDSACETMIPRLRCVVCAEESFCSLWPTRLCASVLRG